MKRFLLLTPLLLLTACDSVEKRKDLENERKDAAYRSAMADYQAGRLDQAVKEFADVVGRDPANASARFQLACLLQDHARDHLGALCEFREYLRQHPESDKSRMARDRMATCERELAVHLAGKYGLNVGEAFAKEAEHAKAELVRASDHATRLAKDNEAAFRRIATLRQEVKRLKDLIKDSTPEEAQPQDVTAQIKDAKTLLDGGEDQVRTAVVDDIAALKAEEAAERAESSPTILPVQAEGAKNARDAARAAAKKEREDAEKSAMTRPETYVVQEGDTLYKIALRFYGRSSAWSRIRDANKAKISLDGRVQTGQTITLPSE